MQTSTVHVLLEMTSIVLIEIKSLVKVVYNLFINMHIQKKVVHTLLRADPVTSFYLQNHGCESQFIDGFCSPILGKEQKKEFEASEKDLVDTVDTLVRGGPQRGVACSGL